MKTSIPLLIACTVFSLRAQEHDTNKTFTPTPPPAPLPQKEAPAPSTGSLHIIAFSENAIIYLDGKEVGTGECTMKQVPIGPHEVFMLDGDKSKNAEAYVIEGVTRTIKAAPERETFVNVMSTFSNAWCHGIRAYGPSLDIGIQHKASYFGLNFHWGFFNDYYWRSGNYDKNGEGMLVGGAALQWYYTVYSYKEIFEVAPGLASGYWYFDGEKYAQGYTPETDYYSDRNEYFEEMFFTGPSVRLSVGFKRLYLTAAYTMLIGTNLGHVLVFGTRVVM